MLNRLRQCGSAEGGFTLIELLVVILIIGILAAIAIPSFLNQKSKANDASAKELAHTAQTTAETYATDHNGSYSGIGTDPVAGALVLQGIEPTINTSAGSGNAYLSGAVEIDTPNVGDGYIVTATSTDGNTYSIQRNGDGTVVRSCTVAALGNAGGCVDDSW